ncbi:ubiquinol oxidase subunit II [Pseudoxanthomonas sp.]|uniref:ubiquinol oxidase subunit II n=1 Tax=Pseudoxanthomonas sp. TaxID=1871049 RepID=UPI00262B8C75|nr:ubiquinol oxidase subunit II [Pseudoxanthomonas sp.]WDS34851.1 MAG: ubiquinol oxidase subunit II [Pseudoxanthomonas sp.]
MLIPRRKSGPGPIRATATTRLRRVTQGTAALLLPLLSGCSLELMNPKGAIGEHEKSLILLALALMLMVVVPVIVLTLYFAWHYRETNEKATYAPKWSHSTAIEIVVWSIPCLIVTVLAVLIWRSTHDLDPYKPIAHDKPALNVEVVALNWKWLFIYPDQGVASVNQLVLPVDQPVAFKITAESIMNSFFIPQLGSQIYAMAGMQTQLHLISDTPGDYAGMSASYSGAGFSDMHFRALVKPQAEFEQWLASAKASPYKLDAQTFTALEQPSTGAPVRAYQLAMDDPFDAVLSKYGPMDAHGVQQIDHASVQFRQQKPNPSSPMPGMRGHDMSAMSGPATPATQEN